jgi:hypothetical protein
MPQVLVAGATIQCSHKGTARLPNGDARLQVAGQPAVTAGMEAGISFAPGAPTVITPCPLQTTTTPPAPSPCTATVVATAGISAILIIGGAGVLLDTATGPATNANDPGATWSVLDAGQTLLIVER